MNRKNPKYRFKKAWSWPEDVEKFLSSLLLSPSLHVCCGASKLGDVKVDLYYEAKNIIRADMFNLPFRDNYFASVLTDPPWHLAYHLRPRLGKELCRVIRPGGVLIFNSPWRLGLTKSLNLEAVYFSDAPMWRNYPIIQIYRKAPTLDI